MKKILAACLVGAIFCACAKEQTTPSDSLYKSWHVVSIESKLASGGTVNDTTQNGAATDSINLAPGQIIFKVKGWEHIDTYDATRYSISAGAVPLISGVQGIDTVRMQTVATDDFLIIENGASAFQTTQVTYHIKK